MLTRLQKKRKGQAKEIKAAERAIVSPFEKISDEILIYLLGFLKTPEIRLVNTHWYQIYKTEFLPQRKREVLKLLLGQNLIEKLIKEHKTFDAAMQKIEETVNFRAIVNDLDLKWLNEALLDESKDDLSAFFSPGHRIVSRLEMFIWTRFPPFLALKNLGMKKGQIEQCSALSIAAAYLKQYGLNEQGYSLVRIFAEAGFDRAIAFLIANGARSDCKDPDRFTSLKAVIMVDVPITRDLNTFTHCIEILMEHGAQFPPNQEGAKLLIEAFFYRKLSDFIFERIDLKLLQYSMPLINEKFLIGLKKYQGFYQGNFPYGMPNSLDICDKHLSLLYQLLKSINLSLWLKYSGDIIIQPKCLDSLKKMFPDHDLFEQLISDEEQYEVDRENLNFKTITDEHIKLFRLFERRNSLIMCLLSNNLQLRRLVEEKNAEVDLVNSASP